MSGHSRWANIKHKKASVDAKRGKLFSRLVKEITLSVKEGGKDVHSNLRLKLALEKAKEANVPSKNIENAIKRGSGELKGEDLVEVLYEGYAKGGVALLVECVTDNKNRTLTEVRTTLNKNGGSMGESGSVSWQFEKKGIFQIEKECVPDENSFMSELLEMGVEDVEMEEEGYTLYTSPNDFNRVSLALKEKKIQTLDEEVNYVSKNFIDLSPEDAERVEELIEKLEDLDDTSAVASNHRVVK